MTTPSTTKKPHTRVRTERRMCSHEARGICAMCKDPRRRLRFVSREPMPSLLHRATAHQ